MKWTRWTIRRNLWFLAGLSLLVLVVVETINSFDTRTLSIRIHDLGSTQLPAVRSMTLADMVHDGIRAVVFRAVIATVTQDKKEMAAAKTEYGEFSKAMNEHIEKMNSVVTDPDVRQSIKDVSEEIEKYISSGQEVLLAADSGNHSEALKKLPQFQEQFEALESRLDKLGDQIEKLAEQSVNQSEQESGRAQVLGLSAAVAGMLFSIFMFFLLSKSIALQLSQMSSTLGEGANELGIAVTELASASSDLSASSTQQSSALEQTASAVHEISSMVKRSAELAQSAEANSNQSKERAEKGSFLIQDMRDSMKSIQEKTESLALQTKDGNEKLSSIVKVIDEVVQKTKVINEIVFQTKLLSFNASVEAARAGENGKGFAVVAQEVGHLARMSGNAAEEINSLLAQSLTTVKTAVEETRNRVEASLAETKSAVDHGGEYAEQCGQVFDEIAKASIDLFEMVTSISKASGECAKGVEEISRSLSDLSGATQVNATAAASCAGASKKLEEQAVNLRHSANALNQLVAGSDMINKFEWKEVYRLGVQAMDDEHQILIDKINFLADRLAEKSNVFEAFEDLVQYTRYHFAEEETYMTSIRYAGITGHKKLHVTLLDQLDSFGPQIQAGSVSPAELMNFLNDWLLKHILGVDMKYARFSRQKNAG